MRCSARSFSSASSSSARRDVVLGGLAARPRPGDRVGDDATAGDLDQRLGAGADDVVGAAVGVRQAEEVHVRARVGRPQRAVDVERRRRAGQREPLRDDDLERLARPDRLLAPLDHVVELLLGVRARHVRRSRLDDRDGAVGGFGELRGHPVEAVDGVGPRPLDPLVGGVVVDRVGDEEQRAVGVVEDGEVGGEQHPDLGQVELVASGVGNRLPAADRVVGDRADHAAGQRRQAVDPRGVASVSEGASRASVGSPPVGTPTGGVADPVRLAVLLGQGGVAAGPDDRVPRPHAAVLGRLEEERARARRGPACGRGSAGSRRRRAAGGRPG